MIDSLSITDLRGLRFAFTIGENPTNHKHPVNHWQTDVEVRKTLNNKMQSHGVWSAPTLMGACTITIEGAVFGDTYADFNAQYLALKTIVHPIPGVSNRENTKVGTLRVKPTGLSQLETDFTLESFSCPLDGNTYAEWQLILKSFDPYFIQSSSEAPIFY